MTRRRERQVRKAQRKAVRTGEDKDMKRWWKMRTEDYEK